jgi:acetoin utilization deacetylase AcuC-like enzyme
MRTQDYIPIFYRDEQVARVQSFSPSAAKPAKLMARYHAEEDIAAHVKVFSFEPTTATQLTEVHASQYVNGVLRGEQANGFGGKDPDVAKSFLYTTGSFLAAAQFAAKNQGWLVHSPTSGFHHAGPHGGGGFCTFNGLALAAKHLLGENRRVGILDLDMHYGNGTDACLREYIDAGIVPHVTESWRDSASCLAALPRILDDVFGKLSGRGVLLYQAGADSHEDDPLGGYLTTDAMRYRDMLVFQWAKRHNVSVAWNLAGGYQVVDGEPTPVLDLHVATMREAIKAAL